MTLTLPSTRPSLSCSARYATRRRVERPTFGRELARIASALGQPFMPWQRHVADVGGEYDPDTGIPFYREVVVTVPRQSGKTSLFLSWQVHRCTARRWSQPQRSAFTAQSGRDARDKWIDELYPLIKGSRVNPLVRQMNQGMGNESIAWKTGSLIRLLSTSSSSGHSKTLHQAVLDEIWHDADHRREQGLRPAMLTIPDAQLLVCSTAGTALSVVLNGKVASGRRAVEKDSGRGVAYFDWGAPDDWDPDDEDSYYEFMPALCPDPPCRCSDEWRHTVTMDVIRGERASMAPDEFARAYGNVYSFPEGDSVFDPAAWAALHDVGSRASDPVAFAVDATPERDRTAVAVAGARADGRIHGEIVDHRPGTGWVADRVAQLVADHAPCAVVVHGNGPAGSLLPALEVAGVEPLIATNQDMAKACGDFYDAVIEGRLRYHAEGRFLAALNAAVAGARRKEREDVWTWARKGVAADISPLVALTLALWGHATRAHRSDQVALEGSLMA